MLHVLSTAGASVLAVGYVMPMIYFIWSLKYGPGRRRQSVGRHRPRMEDRFAAAAAQFRRDPVVTHEAYDYSTVIGEEIQVG